MELKKVRAEISQRTEMVVIEVKRVESDNLEGPV